MGRHSVPRSDRQIGVTISDNRRLAGSPGEADRMWTHWELQTTALATKCARASMRSEPDRQKRKTPGFIQGFRVVLLNGFEPLFAD